MALKGWAHHHFNIERGRYATWSRQHVQWLDPDGSFKNVSFPVDHDAVKAFVEEGGKIELPGPPEAELGFYQQQRVFDIRNYAQKRIDEVVHPFHQKALLWRLKFRDYKRLKDVENSKFIMEMYNAAENYIEHVYRLIDPEAVRLFEPEKQPWPSPVSRD